MIPSAIRRQITRSSLSSLQSQFLHTAQSFQSYNFREYFVRLSKRKFSDDLEAIVGKGKARLPAIDTSASASDPIKQGEAPADGSEDLLASLSEEQQEALKQWFEKQQKELEQLKRASIVNNLFVAPPLVVEGKGIAMTQGGGGAGMEASAGGAGQEVNPEDPIHTKPEIPGQ